ncbi:MAG: enoyl-CoA hydratase/isomerase family protein, partial [Alphaproteobacteria bacterium]|nr:enoyl-CoA hydratase/isomerase family protein [Alphaproteobacteria bacterium]
MSASLPATEAIALERRGAVLTVTLNRPEARNAMNSQMVRELNLVFDAIRDDRAIRVVILRGSGGIFCAGGDIKDMARAGEAPPGEDAMRARNRSFGALCRKVDAAPQAVVAVVEGAAMGGGFGLVCVSDIAIAYENARFAMPEVTLGVVPAQIAPFVVARIGMTEARRHALTGERIDGPRAKELGLVHYLARGQEDAEAILRKVLGQLMNAAPGSIAATKSLLSAIAETPAEMLLDRAADLFISAVRGPEGREGTRAFVEKR